jgi:hypothetical protein
MQSLHRSCQEEFKRAVDSRSTIDEPEIRTRRDTKCAHGHPHVGCSQLRGKKIKTDKIRNEATQKWQATRRSIIQRGLDLSFDIDLAEGRDLCGFEERARLPGQKAEPVFTALEEMLAIVVIDKLCGVGVGLEA